MLLHFPSEGIKVTAEKEEAHSDVMYDAPSLLNHGTNDVAAATSSVAVNEENTFSDDVILEIEGE